MFTLAKRFDDECEVEEAEEEDIEFLEAGEDSAEAFESPQVRIKSGPFAGLEGKILRRKGKIRLLVTLELIQSAMLLEVDAVEAQLAC